jgi:hypothetical protein
MIYYHYTTKSNNSQNTQDRQFILLFLEEQIN